MDSKVIKRILDFRNNRDWKQFHTPESLAKSLAIESGELLECFQWNPEFKKEDVLEELADILIYAVFMADTLNVDLNNVINNKMDINDKKYTVEKSKGNSKKYTEL